MGAKGESQDLGLKDLHDLLGDRAPQMEFSPRGRLRLVTALRNRFGDNYRSLRGIEGILKEFDKEADFNVRLQQMKMIRAKGGTRG